MDEKSSPEETGQLIYEAVIYDNEELLQELLEANPGKVYYRDKHGRSALHIAAQNGNIAILDLLIEAGADVNSMAGPSALCATPLHVAAVAGRLEAVQHLIEAGAELLATDLRDHCALELAQMANQFETACLLIDAIESVRNKTRQLHDDLVKSTEEGDFRAVIEVLPNLTSANYDAILNGATLDRKCVLYLACLNGRKEVVEALLNVRGHTLIQPSTHDTVLHAAISSRKPVIVEMILKAFTHLVTAKNADGSTALHWASQCGSLDIVKLLLEFPYEEDVLTKIEDASGRFSYRFVLDVNGLDVQCRTALYLAVANSYYDVVKYLLEVEFLSMNSDQKCPFEVDVYCSGGKTPLMVAAANGDIALVKLLVDHGADVNLPCGLTDADISSVDGARCIGSGALSEACRIGCFSLVQLLLQRGAVDNENVALATAFKYNQDSLARLFLLRLAFVDPEYRVSKNIDLGQVSVNRNQLSSAVYPTTPCMLNWHNASLETVSSDWLIAASLQVNQRLRTSRMALAALTRIDLSKNKIKKLNGQLLQLSSLRSLNAANNEIIEIEIPSDGFHAPLLESLLLEFNKLSLLPDELFTSRLPMLNFLDVSHNKLCSLPETLWFAPRLRELNVSNNTLTVLPAVGSLQFRPSSSLSEIEQPESFYSDLYTHQSTLSTDDSLSVNGRNDESNITIHELKRHNIWQTSIRLARSEESDTENGPLSFSSMISVFNVSHNNIKVMPSCLACCCPYLTRLNISHNQLTSLGPVQCLPSRLRHLDVSNNQLVVAFECPTATQLVCHAVNVPSNEISPMRRASPLRNSRSRSKSAVRSQRSLSVAPAGDSCDTFIDACPHKQHTRLESLRTFLVANNRLTEIPLLVPSLKNISSPKKKQRENRQKYSAGRRQMLFPALTTLDVSNNYLSNVPATLSDLVSLSVLNLSGNNGIEMLPPELGLLSKLWNLILKGCSLRDPLKSMVYVESYKTVDLIAYLKSILEDSRPYTRLKLMIVGVQGIGKTSLLQQIRLEGTVGKRTLPNDSWSKRMGRNAGSGGDRTPKGANISTVGVDIAEWTFEPKKTKGEPTFGPLTFRTWDFGGQREYYATHQYFLSRRSLYVLVWKVTDGEAALPDLRQWLVNIQARAPNSPVIIVGTHVDQIFSNPERFPSTYLDDLNTIIRDHFVVVPDADKKGLPRVVESLFVSSKTKQNIRVLCNLLYRTAYDIRIANSKERLLDQKIPASYMALEKIVVELADERRSTGIEPVLRSNDFRTIVQERMLKNYGRAFRDDIEFNHACSFLHENGVILHYEDVTLRELYFLDPQWLCDILAHVITIREINPFARNGLMKIDDLQMLFKSLNLSNSAINLRSHIISLLQKFEVALCWQSRSLLIPSLLPDEYQLRGGYPGSKVMVPTRATSWQLAVGQRETKKSLIMKAPHLQVQALFSQRNLGGTRYRATVPLTTLSDGCKKSPAPVSVNRDESEDDKGARLIAGEHKCIVNMEYLEQEIVRRIYMMAYIPSGFWSRLMTRVLVDDHITMCVERLLEVEYLSEGSSLEILNELCDRQFLSYWLLWQTGFEILAFEKTIFIMRQFLPLAEVRDVHYEIVEWHCCAEDSNWRTLDMNGSSLIEIIIPSVRINLVSGEKEYVLRSNRAAVTRLLALIVDIMDTLLEDWYPSLGTRFVHTSEGCLLVNRLVPCLKCASSTRYLDTSFKVKQNDGLICETSPKQKLHAFTVEECILSAHDGVNLRCPLHSDISVVDIAPDTVFLDINEDYLIQPTSVKRGKLIGHGAFGFVFKAAIRFSDANVQVAALKMLEPVEPGLGARTSSVSAYKAAYTKWQRDPLQNACRAYCTCRQELNVLASLQHSHITALIGVCSRPLALLVELAPLGALNHLLNNYRRSGARLRLSVIQDTASQVAKALEYLHEHRIIYRDLKCENVLTWRFPPPFSSITDVLVKLGDYGISRSSFPSGGAKGFGGTEGFMAPEIIRYNGEQEYTEKVDCFSFAMFLYELISLKLPFDGHEQLKEYVLDGGRPRLTPSELLYPCNVLDVMVVCWAAQPVDRPSASQIVSMTTAPEFTHLLDVISLNDPDSIVNASISFPTLDDVELGSTIEDSVEGEIWMSRSDGSVTVLSCNQYGWLDSKSIIMNTDKTVILAMCVVNDNVWLAESTGILRIYCRSSYSELWSFSISRFLPTAHLSISVISLSIFITTPLLILVTLPSALLLVKGDRTPDSPFVSSIGLSTIHSSAVIDYGQNVKQIWTGHEHSSITIYDVTLENRLTFAANICHGESQVDAIEKNCVSHMVTTGTDSALLWSVLSHGSKVYQWSTASRKVRNRLDSCKILPSSESISTLDIEASRDGYVSALALLDRTDCAQLYIGTSRGAVIVAQAFEMRPLAAFRPYVEDVHTIIVLDVASALNEYMRTHRDFVSMTSLRRRSFGANSSSSGGDPQENVNWVKDRVSETVDRFRQDTTERVSSLNSYVITVGNGYRCLIDRFTDRKHQGSATLRRDSHCAIIWRTDEWVS
ncbi:TKL/LRRK protein kinase [Loa loa]|uniref:non-specific serine/threonine protein kinase n=1 Tax=Loa loa TaxID=7209 RepID=A0A1S0U6H6_LOALO|nr:TKL/LRRK protein kinase [Loa loa]EFO25986.1 TKL/LRRK protein kinase [Loa loa]